MNTDRKVMNCKTPCSKGHVGRLLLLAACLAAVSASAQTKLFEFGFNEGTGATTTSSINGIVGTLGVDGVTNSAPAFSSDSPSGRAGDYSILFAEGNRIQASDPAAAIAFDGTNTFTFQAWVKFSGMANWRSMIFDNNGPGARFAVSIMADRTLSLTTYGFVDGTSKAKIPDDGMWHQIAVVHEDGVGIKYYVDGILGDRVDYTDGVKIGGPQTYFHVGGEVWDWPNYGDMYNGYVGKIDRMSLTKGVVAAGDLDWRPIPGVTPPAPSLSSPKPAIEISWPTFPAGYKLQSTTTVDDTNSWVDVPNSPSTVGPGTYYYYGPSSSPKKFYRLLKP